MTRKHKLVHFISLLAIVVNLLVPLGAPLVTAQDILDSAEPSVTSDQTGTDSNTGAAQVVDDDLDGIDDAVDNCVGVVNSDQSDIDGDGIGDACDPVNDLDRDGDGVLNDVDNCPDATNADQTDLDRDGIGDACDSIDNTDTDGDGLVDTADTCPAVKPVKDADGDGCEDKVEAPEQPVVSPSPTPTSVPKTNVSPSRVNANEVTETKLDICHSTSSAGNPFSLNNVSLRAVLSSHYGGHNGRIDVIPAFTYQGTFYPSIGNQNLLNYPNCIVPIPNVPVPVAATCTQGSQNSVTLDERYPDLFSYDVSWSGNTVTVTLTPIGSFYLTNTPSQWAPWQITDVTVGGIATQKATWSYTFGPTVCPGTLPTLTSTDGVCRDLPSYTFTAGAGFTIKSVTVNGSAASTTPGTYTITSPQQNNTVTVKITLIQGYSLPDMAGWTLVSGNTYTKTVSPTYRVCTQAVVPGISIDPYVCTAGVTLGANTFTVDALTGMTLVSVNLDGNPVSTTAGTFDLPAANGTYTITVRATLNPDAVPPGGYSPDENGIYTFTQSVTVAACVSAALPTFTPTAAVCTAGVVGSSSFSWTTPTGVSVSASVDGGAAVTSSPITLDGKVAHSVEVTLTLQNGYKWPTNMAGWNVTGTTATQTFTVPAKSCLGVTIPTFTPTAAVCTAGVVGNSSFSWTTPTGVSVSASVDGGAAVTTSPITLDGKVAHSVVVTLTLTEGYAWPANMTGWNVTGTTATQTFTVPAKSCLGVTIPVFTPTAAVCVQGQVGPASFSWTTPTGVSVSASVNGGAAVTTSPIALDGSMNNSIAVTLTLTEGYEWPASMTGWTVTGTTATRTFTVDKIECKPDIQIAKSVTQNGQLVSTVEPGSAITWVISLWNTGDGPGTVTVTDTIPAGFTAGTLPQGCSLSGSTITCSNVTVLWGTTQANPVTISIPGTVAAAGATCGPITNRASFSPNAQGAPEASASVNINCQPNLDMSKTASVETVEPGGTIIWTIKIWNTGTANATVNFSDTMPPGFTWQVISWNTGANCGSAGGGSGFSCSNVLIGKQTSEAAPAFTVTITGRVANDGLTCGPITNQATLTPSAGGNSIVRPSTVNVNCDPAHTLAKTVDKATVSEDGTVLTYTVTVANTGNTDLAPFVVQDTFSHDIANVTGPLNVSSAASVTRDDTTGNFTISGLGEGETVTFQLQYTVTQADIDSGQDIQNCVNDPLPVDDEIVASVAAVSNCATTTIEQRPGIDVGKTSTGLNLGVVAPNDVANPGDTISFNITVRNSGNTTRTNVAVTEDVAVGNGTIEFGTPTGGTITTAGNVITVTSDIAPGGVVTIPVTYTITQQDIDRGSMMNCASTYPQVGNDPDCAPVTIPQSATFTFTKDGPSAPIVPGEAMQFTITFTNTGNVTIANATIADVLPPLPSGTWEVVTGGASESLASLPYNVTNLAPGESVILIATAMVPAQIETPNTTWCKQWDNTATVTGSFANQASISGTDSASAQVNCTSLQITKTGSATVLPGETVSYNITVENLGNTTAYGVTVNDTLDSRLSILTSDLPVGCSISGQEITCVLASLAPGGVWNIAFTPRLIAQPTAVQCDTDIANFATISTFSLTGQTMRALGVITPPGTVITSNTVTTDILCTPKIEWEKTVVDGTVTPGEDIVFNITVRNTGTYYILDLVVTDTLPAGLADLEWTIVDSDAGTTCERTGAIVTCSNIDLGAYGGFVTITLTAKTTAEAPVCGEYTNTATLTNAGERTAKVTIACAPKVEAAKTTATTNVTAAGTVINYTVTIENQGNQILPNLAVNDTLLSGPALRNVTWGPLPAGVTLSGNTPIIASLGINQTVTLSASYTVSQADINLGGPIYNCIVVLHDVNRSNNCTTTTVTRTPGIDITKQGPTTVNPGGTVTYTLKVKNTGNVTAFGLNVNDLMPAGLFATGANGNSGFFCVPLGLTISCIGGTLDPNQEATITVTAVATARPSTAICDNGFRNVATVTGFAYGGPVSDTSNEVHTALNCQPKIEWEKTVVDSTVSPGENIVFKVTVKNTGTYYKNDIQLTDNLPAGLAGLTWQISTNDPAANCERVGDNILCTNIDLDAYGDSFVLTLTAATTAEAPVCGEYTNTASETNGDRSSVRTAKVTIECVPDYEIEKTSALTDTDENGEVSIGDTITYTIHIENNGNQALSGLTLSDVFSGSGSLVWTAPAGFDGVVIPSIAVGDDLELVATYVVTQADVDAGMVENCATVTLTGTQLSERSCADDDVPQYPAIDVEKSAVVDMTVVDPADRVDAGDEIAYTITVENTGNVTLTNVVVTDPLVGLSETVTSMAPGDVKTFTVTYVVLQSDLDAGSVYNCADTSGEPPLYETPGAGFMAQEIDPSEAVYDEACISTDLPDEPSIDVEKTDSLLLNVVGPADRVDAGDQIEYTITVENTGNVTLTNVVVEDPLVGFSETIASLAPGAVETFTVTYTVTLADIDAGTVQNCADATGDVPFVPVPQFAGMQEGEPYVYDEDCIDTTLENEPGIDIEKASTVLMDVVDPADRVDAGDTIEYTFTVENTGNVTLTNVVVVDPMITDSMWVDDPNIGTLLPGEVREITAIYVVNQIDLDAGEVYNCAEATGEPPLIDIIVDRAVVAITGEEPMPTSASDEDCVTTDTPRVSSVVLEKTGTAATGDDDVLNLGEVITYAFTVTNTGNATLTNLTVHDPLVGITWVDGNTIASLAPGESVELKATYTVTQADVDLGTVVNCADISGMAPDESEVADDDCDTQMIDQNPAIMVGLVCPNPSTGFLPNVGDKVVLEITITNNGDLTVSDIEVTTSRDGELGSPFPATLEPGKSETRTFTVVVTQADYDAREIALEVSAVGTLPDGSSAELASMVMMQVESDTVENTFSIVCPMDEVKSTTPTPPVTSLPNTGSGNIAASGAIIWAAAFTMIALGAGALGIRRKYQ